MTLEEIKKLKKPFLTPREAAGVMNCDPYSITLMARERPDLLGFPVTVLRTRTKIPRVPFVKFWEGK